MSTSSNPELKKLRQRLLDKEISEETYQELKKEILEEIEGETGQSFPVRSDSIDFGAEPLAPGEKIGPLIEAIGEPRYLIEAEIGRGGWGVVYRADDRKLKMPVAIKAVFAAATQNKKAFKRIYNEAKLGMTLTHPNIVRIIDFDDYQGKYFLVMELVTGGDLTVLLAERDGEKLELAETVELLKGVSEGLDYMHSMGIVHRDLKPENLLWHPDQKLLKITDFGFAYTARQSVLLSGIAVSKLSGTEPYMAPEIWQAEEPSQAGDLYALGILAYEMIKGDPPFPGPNFEHQHCNVLPRPLQNQPDSVNQTLLKMLAKDPAERYESALIFHQELSKPPFPECPVCGKAEDVTRFNCAECGKTDICQTHRQRDKYCPDCIQKIIAEEAANAEKERLEREQVEAARLKQMEDERREQERVDAQHKQKLEEERLQLKPDKTAKPEPPVPMEPPVDKTYYQLIKEAAISLDKSRGKFSRKDIKNWIITNYQNFPLNVDSLNPQIQGVTKNAPGGAPGYEGREFLIRVERGRYELFKEGKSKHISSTKPKSRKIFTFKKPKRPNLIRSFGKAKKTLFSKTGLIIILAALVLSVAFILYHWSDFAKSKRIQKYLGEAELCITKKRPDLVYPKKDCAYYYYQEVLRIDSANSEAKEGLKKTANLIESWGDRYMGKGDHLEAQKYYWKFLSVFSNANVQTRVQRCKDIENIHKKANHQLKSNHLTSPKGDNAYESYQRMLILHSNNIYAQRINNRIVDKYEQWGDKEKKSKNWQEAIDYYNKAIRVGGHNSEISKKTIYCKNQLVESTTPAPGSLIDGPLPGMKFAYIPAGSFMMGSNDGDEDEKPVHSVTLQPFYMMTTEVTQAMWKEMMGDNPSNWKRDNLPVEQVNWKDCQEFIKKLNLQYPGKGYRLPTEAEWEYACRAGTKTKYSSGNSEFTLARVGWYGYDKGNSKKQSHPVGQKKSNKWGLYDMHGNVWEWCEDWYDDSYNGASNDASAWKYPTSSYRVSRGGSWRSSAWQCRSTDRCSEVPSLTYCYDGGFRLVHSP